MASDSHSDPEKGNGSQLSEHLQQVLTQTMSISPEIYEKVYLQPKDVAKGDLRKKFANPTPIALIGFCIALTPLSAQYMSWRGSGGDAVATAPASIFFGGSLMTIAGLLEFILGNTYPCAVFFGFGAHFLTVATVFIPWFNSIGYYSPSGVGPPNDPAPEFFASFGYYPLAMCMLSVVYLLGALRTNLVFVVIFMFASTGFGCAAGGFWHLAAGNVVVGDRLLVGTGACFWGAAMLGWYLLVAVMIEIMELPIPDLPVLDLSTIIKAKSRNRT